MLIIFCCFLFLVVVVSLNISLDIYFCEPFFWYLCPCVTKQMFSNKYQNEYKIAESFHIKEMDGKIPQKKNTTHNTTGKT